MDGLSWLGDSITTSPGRTTQERVANLLRQAIVEGVVKGGTRLAQADISQQLGVSTTPVREALRELAAERLIALDAHKGAVVRVLGVPELLEIYETRLAVEPLLLRQSIPALSAGDLRHAQHCHRALGSETDPGKWVLLNRDFHEALMRAARWSRLRDFAARLQSESAIYVGRSISGDPPVREQADRDHEAILDAAMRRDVDAVLYHWTRHLEATIASVQRLDLDGPAEERALTLPRQAASRSAR